MFGWVLFRNTNIGQSPEVTTLHASTSSPSCEETLHTFWTLEEPLKPKLPLSPTDLLRRRANARNVSFRISLRWLTYIVNSVDKTKLSIAN